MRIKNSEMIEPKAGSTLTEKTNDVHTCSITGEKTENLKFNVEGFRKMLSKRIDNLTFSIKPKHFEKFKKNLIQRLMYQESPCYVPIFLVMHLYFIEALEKDKINVPEEQMLDHTIMFMSLMNGPDLTDEDFEYELTGKNITEEYYENFMTPIILSYREEYCDLFYHEKHTAA